MYMRVLYDAGPERRYLGSLDTLVPWSIGLCVRLVCKGSCGGKKTRSENGT